MTLSIHAVTPDFVAEVGDVALNAVSPEDLAAIRAAFTKYAVLIFPDQEFDDESQLAFARHFGPLETTVFKARKDHRLRLHENMADVGNLDAENRILEANNRQRLYNLGNRLWHTDSSFKRLPAYCSMLHARSIPPIYARAARTMGSCGLHRWTRVILPASLPFLVSGMKQGWAFAWRSLMAAEIYVTILTGFGLGQLLHYGRELHAMEQVFGVMVVIVAIGLAADRVLFASLERSLHRRWGTGTPS